MSDYRERAIKSYDRETTPRRTAFYGTRISPNQIKTVEDYTIYLNVPIARVGEQEYLPSELGLTGNDPVSCTGRRRKFSRRKQSPVLRERS